MSKIARKKTFIKLVRIVYRYSYRPTAEYINNVTEKNTTTQTVRKTYKHEKNIKTLKATAE